MLPQTHKQTLYFLHGLCLSFVLTGDSFAQSPSVNSVTNKLEKNIVVTIKPLYSLVAQLCTQICQPTLLITQQSSSHHYHLKPSQRRLIARSDILIWIGAPMESYLTKIINDQKNKLVISAMQAQDLQILALRGKLKQTETQQKQLHNSHKIDPHVWLSPENAIAISRHISKQLIKNNPANTTQFKKNLEQLIQKIQQQSKKISTQLTQQGVYISYHDAFQYFEKYYQLNYAGSVVFNEETGASLKQIKHIHQLIKQQKTSCLVYQNPAPKLVQTLATNKHLKTQALDPMGWQFAENNAWFELMQQLSHRFAQCLN